MNDISMHWPRISIVTPSFNSARFIEDTIKSVISQKYPNLEYFIIDGGSTDGTLDIIKKYESHLTAWISEPDNGMYHAIQKGFEKSTGEIMAWINSDDMYHNKALFTVADIFMSFPDQVNWILGASTVFDEYGRTIFAKQSDLFTKWDLYDHNYNWIQQESVFWRRKLWETAGSSFNINLKYAGDFNLWFTFFKYDKLFVTHALIGGFRFSIHQITRNYYNEYLKEVELVLNSLQLSREEYKIIRGYKIIQRIEKTLRQMKIFKTGWFQKKYREKYFNIGNYIIYDRVLGRYKIIS